MEEPQLPRYAFANLALTYAGKVPYEFGGWQPSTGWDCSGAVGYLLSNWGIILPGLTSRWYASSGYHPSDAAAYLTWEHAWTVPQSQAWAGDLYVWETHVGIALDNYYMLSALDAQYGTAVTPVAGFGPANETLTVRRIWQSLF
jgi:cell wall-associated NlpC family hydrolase